MATYYVVTHKAVKNGEHYDKFVDPISIEFKPNGELFVITSDAHVFVFAPNTVESYHSQDNDE